MSLSFVSKSVQTSTEDGKFVEEAIEGASTANETTEVHKPLFEQLRANQEQQDAEQAEYQQALMRGTLALDEEDAAHLDSLRRKQQEHDAEVNRQTEEELAAFRAARADRSEASNELKQPSVPVASTALGSQPEQTVEQNTAKPKLAPQIIIKRKRRKTENDDVGADKKSKASSSKDEDSKKKEESQQSAKSETKQAALGSLLTGYGSSSDED